MRLRTLTAGESHGPGLVGILEGFPAGVRLDLAQINADLTRRQGGFGRGARMQIENDKIQVLAGLRGGLTLGSPIALFIENKDHANWADYMDPSKEPKKGREVTKPRPGHADLSGALKYGFDEVRPVLERSSARETAMRTALGSICAQLLAPFNIEARSHVLSIGNVSLANQTYNWADLSKAHNSDLRCIDAQVEEGMHQEIQNAKDRGDSLGGLIEVVVQGVPVGLGSYVHWDRKLDARMAYALMSIQGMKAVEIGAGLKSSTSLGSEFHDPIYHQPNLGFYRQTNRAGGIEGGVSTGENLVLRLAMKPIPTLLKPLATVDLQTKEPSSAAIERSDVCAVPAASVVAELVAITVVAEAFLEVYGADNLEEIKKRWKKS